MAGTLIVLSLSAFWCELKDSKLASSGPQAESDSPLQLALPKSSHMSAGDRQRVVENLSRTTPVLGKDTMQRK